MISVIGIRFCCQLYLRQLGPSPYLQLTRECESESESESDSESYSADTEVRTGRKKLLSDSKRIIAFERDPTSFEKKGTLLSVL